MKKKKMNEMMNQTSGDKLSMGGASMNPMFGGNPLFGNGPMGGMNPFGMTPSNQSSSNNNGGFNVDDLVKRIDAKIAELEEEERREKEAQEKQKETITIENKTEQIRPLHQEIIQKNDSEQIINNTNEDKTQKINLNEISENKSTKLYEDDTDDDKFFDDFFSDE